jgi:diguanylate cyclase (GGDEF)-like protein
MAGIGDHEAHLGKGPMNRAWLNQTAAAGGRAVLSRLALRAPSEDAVLDDRATMARTFIYLFGIGATLLFVTLPLPHSPDRDTTGLVVVGAVAYAIAAGFLWAHERLPRWLFEISPLCGTVLVSLTVYFGGAEASATYAMYYLWVALAACYFFRPAVAGIHLAVASAAYAIVLAILGGDVELPVLKWALVTGTLAVVGGLMIVLREQLRRLVGQLGAAARTDSLTGLANRRDLEDRFAAELERSTRTGRALSIVVLDLDWFKEFNDRFGHYAGDQALIRLADALRRATRTSDVLARLGGEEFAVLAPETDEPEGLLLAERLRAEVKAAFARETEKMTVSCGVATFPVHGITAGELLHGADRALYEAKEAGRDRSIVFRHAVALEDQEKAQVERTSPRLASLVSLAEAVDRRKGSPANSRRVAYFAEELARSLNLPEEDVERVRIAALLRDVGEVGVEESVLHKEGPLNDEDWRELERHPEIGARIVGAAQLGGVGEWIHTHHERPDGGGYPRGLREHQIPLEGRILAVADAYGAMTAERPYRGAFTPKRARAELQARAGSQFDHDVVEAFLSLDGQLEPEEAARDSAGERGARTRGR